MKNKNLLFKISIIIASVLILSIIILSLLGLKERVGYLSEFKLNIDKTLQINGLDIEETKKLFEINDKLDVSSITNYIFTNNSITNYSYNFRIKYYSKVFRNSDIYGVYPNLDNILDNNNFIKKINISESGSPFGNFISTKTIDTENIDNINYALKIRGNIYLFVFSIIILLAIYVNINYIILLFSKFIKTCISWCNEFNVEHIENSTSSNKLPIIIFLLFAPLIFLLYYTLYSSIYYYLGADSNMYFSRDILLLYNDFFAEFYHHSNIIPYVLFKFIFIPFGKIFDLLSNVNYMDLEQSFNPYFAYIEFVNYCNNVFFIVFLLFLTIMFVNCVKILNRYLSINNSLVYSFTIFFILIYVTMITNWRVYYGFLQLLTIIRFETFGLLFASISLYFVICSSEVNLYDKKHRLYIILSGIMSGAAIFSKIMLLGWVVIIFITYFILNLNKYYRDNNENNTVKLKKLSIIFPILAIIIIIFNIILYQSYINKNIKESAFLYDINNTYLLYAQTIIPIFFIILSITTILLNKFKVSNKIKLLWYNIAIYIISSFFVILFSLLLPYPLDTLFNVYIFNYCLGSILSLLDNSYIIFVSKVLKYLTVFLVLVLLLSVIIFFLRKKLKIIFSNKNIVLLILNILVVLLSFVFMNALRKFGTDYVISYFLIKFAVFLFCINLFIYKKYSKILFILLLIVFSNYSIKHIQFTKYNLQSYICGEDRYFNPDIWYRTDILGLESGIMFRDMFLNTYSNRNIWNASFYWSRDIQKTKRVLRHVGAKLNDTIIAKENSIIDRKSNSCISIIDKNLSGSIITILNRDSNDIYLRKDYDFYFITDIENKLLDNRIKLTDYSFYINDKKYFVYKLNFLDKLGENEYYSGYFNFKKDIDFNNGFILINDRFAKEL